MVKALAFLFPLLKFIPLAAPQSSSQDSTELVRAVTETAGEALKRFAWTLLSVGLLLFVTIRLVLRGEMYLESSGLDSFWIDLAYLAILLLSAQILRWSALRRWETTKVKPIESKAVVPEEPKVAPVLPQEFYDGFMEGWHTPTSRVQQLPPSIL